MTGSRRRRNRESTGQEELIDTLRDMIREQNSTIQLQSQLISAMSARIDANREANRLAIDEIERKMNESIQKTVRDTLDQHPLNQLANWLRVFLDQNPPQCRDSNIIFFR